MYAMFSQFGKVIDVVALKTIRLRGQSWIVFTDVSAATNALRTMQGFPFFDKPIVSDSACSQASGSSLSKFAQLDAQRISFAKTKSDAVAKVDGSYKPSKSERSKKNAAARGGQSAWTHGRAQPLGQPTLHAHPADAEHLIKRNKDRSASGLAVSHLRRHRSGVESTRPSSRGHLA